jgi:hypothetical protein
MKVGLLKNVPVLTDVEGAFGPDGRREAFLRCDTLRRGTGYGGAHLHQLTEPARILARHSIDGSALIQLKAEYTLQNAHPTADMATRNIIKFVITGERVPYLSGVTNGGPGGVRQDSSIGPEA